MGAMQPAKQKIYIDALSIVPERMSGIGHNTLELIKALAKLPETGKNAQIYLVVPMGKKRAVKRRQLGDNVKIKLFPLPARLIALLLNLGLMPPVDWFLGKGIYLFPNYRNWPLGRSKSFTYVHDLVFKRYPEFVQPKNRAYLNKNIDKWVRRADKVLTLSEFSKKEIQKYLGVPAEKIEVILCGVDHHVFYRRSEPEIQQVRQKYGLPESYVLYLGNIEPRKNLRRLVEAFDSLKSDLKTAYSLVLVGGDGWLNQDIYEAVAKAQINGSKIVRPDAYVPDEDLPALISGAVALVHPALYEGFGIAPLQAMACGVPVMVAHTSSLPEVVGQAAVKVNALSVSSIADGMTKILEDQKLRESLAAASLKRAALFSWEASARKLLNSMIGPLK